MKTSEFPFELAGKLAIASRKVLNSTGIQLGKSLEELEEALNNYDREIFAAAEKSFSTSRKQ
jgi:hypothetical protein